MPGPWGDWGTIVRGMFQEEGDLFDPLCGELARFEVWGWEGPGGRTCESGPWGDWGTIVRGMFQEEGDLFDPMCGELARFEV